MARSTKQPTAPADHRSAGTSRTPKSGSSNGSGEAHTPRGKTRQHDGAPGLGHPIFDELIAELGDPRRSA